MAINGHDASALDCMSDEAILESLRRRQLTSSQRAMVAATAMPRVNEPKSPRSPRIQFTSNYDLFQKNEFNRDIANIDYLVSLMRKSGFLPEHAIHVERGENGKLVIRSGHHRLAAAKKLGIAVYYIICDNAVSITDLEQSTTPWKFVDYVKSYARAGSAPHIAITEYCERTGISMGQAASMLAGESASSGNMAPKVKDGTFQVIARDHAELVGAVVIELRKMRVKFAVNQGFVAAISNCVRLDEFDPQVFLRRVATNLHLMVRQATADQYLDLIDRVYNHKAQQKIALAFLAREAAKARNAINKKKQTKVAKNDRG